MKKSGQDEDEGDEEEGQRGGGQPAILGDLDFKIKICSQCYKTFFSMRNLDIGISPKMFKIYKFKYKPLKCQEIILLQHYSH